METTIIVGESKLKDSPVNTQVYDYNQTMNKINVRLSVTNTSTRSVR